MADESVRLRLGSLDLKRALRILQNAGRPDPLVSNNDLESGLQSLIDDLCELSMHDGLTGLVNARFFGAVLDREIDRCHRTGRASAIMLIDVDHFKQVNDTYGHAVGDAVLQSLAQELRANLRIMDTAARVGGEEFAVFLPECSPEDAIRAAARIHAAISPLEIHVAQHTILVTTSAGLAWSDPRSLASGAALLAQADHEMYRAKNAGRNQLCHPTPETAEVSHEERAALEFGFPEGGLDGT
jgi:diguanylate cyclase (GGDEF)-like protein